MKSSFRAGPVWSLAFLCRRRGPGVVLSALLGSLFFLGSFWQSAQAQTRYKIIHIPAPDGCNSTALGLNDHADVVGFCYQDKESNPFLYSYNDGTIEEIGSLGGQATAATAINNANQIVGYSADSNNNVLAFLFTQNQGITSLGTLTGGSNSEAFAINVSGQIVGDSQTEGDTHRPALFGGDGVQDLGVSTKDSDTLKTAYGVNAVGQIVGRYDLDDGSTHAFLLASGHLTDLGTLGGTGSEALGINQNGENRWRQRDQQRVNACFCFQRRSLRRHRGLPQLRRRLRDRPRLLLKSR